MKNKSILLRGPNIRCLLLGDSVVYFIAHRKPTAQKILHMRLCV